MKPSITILGLSVMAVSLDAQATPLIPQVQGYRGPKTLPRPIFVGPVSSPRDRDIDYLDDEMENLLADHFKPYYIFDSNEAHTQPYEPITLFQVRPKDCVGSGCGAWSVVIQYVFLWASDGGYGASSDCSDAHDGDNQGITVTIDTTDDGRTFTMNGRRAVSLGDDGHRAQPQMPGVWTSGTGGVSFFPYVFFASHKHHQYESPWNDEKDSIYSDYGCNDDVDGNGAHRWACIKGDCSPGDLAYNNVGEPEAHPSADFFSGLSRWYSGESAWRTAPFTGGRGGSSNNSSLSSMWKRNGFYVSATAWSHFTARLIPTW